MRQEDTEGFKGFYKNTIRFVTWDEGNGELSSPSASCPPPTSLSPTLVFVWNPLCFFKISNSSMLSSLGKILLTVLLVSSLCLYSSDLFTVEM